MLLSGTTVGVCVCTFPLCKLVNTVDGYKFKYNFNFNNQLIRYVTLYGVNALLPPSLFNDDNCIDSSDELSEKHIDDVDG